MVRTCCVSHARRRACSTDAASCLPQSRQRLQGKKAGKKRGQRATSNIFAMFDQAQIQEFKEVSSPANF